MNFGANPIRVSLAARLHQEPFPCIAGRSTLIYRELDLSEPRTARESLHLCHVFMV